MAWDWAAYGIALAVLTIAAAFVFGMLRISRSLQRLDRTVARVSIEAEATLLQCRHLANETREAIVISRQSLQGFVTLAEGARALGEAVQTAAQTAVHVTTLCRDSLIYPCHAGSSSLVDDGQDSIQGGTGSLAELGPVLWSLLKRSFGRTASSDSSKSPGTGADPSEGE